MRGPGGALLLTVLVAALGLPACGGVDSNEAEQVVREYLEATRREDPSLCVELVTDRFLEETTGVGGLEGRDICRQQLRRGGNVGLKLLSIEKTTVRDERAHVRVRLELQGERLRQTVPVVEEEGHHLVDGPPVG